MSRPCDEKLIEAGGRENLLVPKFRDLLVKPPPVISYLFVKEP